MSSLRASLLAGLLLAACANPVPAPETAPDPEAARALDPMTLDFGQARVFPTLPAGLRFKPGSPKLTLIARTGGSARVSAALVPEGQGYRLRPADAAAFNRLRDRLVARRAAGRRGSGSVGLEIETCRTRAAPSAGPLAIHAAATPDAPRYEILAPTDPSNIASGAGTVRPCG